MTLYHVGNCILQCIIGLGSHFPKADIQMDAYHLGDGCEEGKFLDRQLVLVEEKV